MKRIALLLSALSFLSAGRASSQTFEGLVAQKSREIAGDLRDARENPVEQKPAAAAKKKVFTCTRADYADTAITFTVNEQSVDLLITSRGMKDVVKGVLLAGEKDDWKTMKKVELSIPLKDCVFSATDKNLFLCKPLNVAAISSEIHPNIPDFPKGPATLLNWSVFSNEKVTTELATGATSSRYVLKATGYGQAMDFSLREAECLSN